MHSGSRHVDILVRTTRKHAFVDVGAEWNAVLSDRPGRSGLGVLRRWLVLGCTFRIPVRANNRPNRPLRRECARNGEDVRRDCRGCCDLCTANDKDAVKKWATTRSVSSRSVKIRRVASFEWVDDGDLSQGICAFRRSGPTSHPELRRLSSHSPHERDTQTPLS